MTKLTIEDMHEMPEYKKPQLVKQLLRNGISVQEIFTKPIPKYYPVCFLKLSFRIEMLAAFAVKDREVMQKIISFLHEYILYEIQEAKKSFSYAPEYQKKCEAELIKTKAYFLGENTTDLHTYFSHVSRAASVGGTPFCDLYYMIAAYNYCYRQLHQVKSPFHYFNLKGFANRVANKPHFFSELAKHFGVEQIPDVRYAHIY
jgi:hypothetical protein